MSSNECSVPPLGDVLVSCRPYEEYVVNFALTDKELLTGPVLDCPGGASEFAYAVRELGGDIVSVDPCYALDVGELTHRFYADRERSGNWSARQPWRFRYTPDGEWDRASAWLSSGERFLADFQRDHGQATGHYLAARLPQLPFPDRSFHLVLSGFLLFSYADRLDLDFHLAAVHELLRVCSGEVRLHPLNDYAGRPYPHLDELLDRLAAEGVRIGWREVTSFDLPADDRTLVLTGAT